MTLNWPELWDEDEQRYRVQTRDGRPARIYTTSGVCHSAPVVGEYLTADMWVVGRWGLGGRSNRYPDLIPEPRTVRRWVNVYEHLDKSGKYEVGQLVLHDTQDAAIRASLMGYSRGLKKTAIPVEWEE